MFEDSTFESNGKIRTRSRNWSLAALAVNGSILSALVVLPLIYPEALPRRLLNELLVAPPPPTQPAPVQQAATRVLRSGAQMQDGRIIAPTSVPQLIDMSYRPAPPGGSGFVVGMDLGAPTTGIVGTLFSTQPAAMVRPAPKGPTHISSGVAAGLLILKTVPGYPALGKAMRIEGTVVLVATISAAGSIENLRVVSGPALLQQAALDAVKSWRYRPYMLNGEPVAVETTVNVVFRMGQ